LFRIGYYHSLSNLDKIVPTVLKPYKVKTFSTMSFLNPLFLIALLTVAVPLLIYLLNLQKPKKVRFSTLAFFDSLKTTALKRIRIKRWLLLAIRILAIVTLVIAASRPFLPSGLGVGSENEPRAVAILIDNSPAMVQVDRNGPFMEQAIELAREVINLSDSEDRFLINVTHGEILNTPFLNRGNILNRLSDVEPENKGGYLRQRLLRLSKRLEDAREGNKMIYLITNARESHFESLTEDFTEQNSNVNVQVLKVGSSTALNTGFRDVEIETGDLEGGGSVRFWVSVENFSPQPAENQFLSFIVDGELISQQPFELDAGANSTFIFSLPELNTFTAEAEFLIEGDELTYDNRYYAAVKLPEVRRILVLEDRVAGRIFNSYLKPLLDVAGDESERFEVEFVYIQDLQLSELFNFDAVILDGVREIPDYLSQALVDHVQSGAGLLLLPAADGNINNYNRLLSVSNSGRFSNINGSYGSFNGIDRMATPEVGHPILESIFDSSNEEEVRLNVPDIFYYYEIESAGGTLSFPILNTRAGRPLMQETRVGTGRFIYSAIGSDPGWSNFPIKPFFAPLFFRTVEYLAQGEGALLNSHILGDSFRAIVQSENDIFEIEKSGEVIVPNTRQTFQGMEISYHGEEWEPGWMRINTGGQSILYSVNQNAMESKLNTLDIAEVKEILENYFSNVNTVDTGSGINEMLSELKSASFGKEIWFWFILAAILLLIMESIISRFYRAESIS
jgi:hypothetical protein